MSIKHSVSLETFAERHYAKSFAKKYGRAWDITIEAVLWELQDFDLLLTRSIAEIIISKDKIKICKVEFKVAGTPYSRHASGNRCIVAWHQDCALVKILLIYHKNDLSSKNETAAWKNLIKENYSEYRDLIK